MPVASAAPSESLLLGVDIGGTSVRAQVSDLAGTHVGSGRAGGGNPNAVGMDTAVENIRTALEASLSGAR